MALAGDGGKALLMALVVVAHDVDKAAFLHLHAEPPGLGVIQLTGLEEDGREPLRAGVVGAVVGEALCHGAYDAEVAALAQVVERASAYVLVDYVIGGDAGAVVDGYVVELALQDAVGERALRAAGSHAFGDEAVDSHNLVGGGSARKGVLGAEAGSIGGDGESVRAVDGEVDAAAVKIEAVHIGDGGGSLGTVAEGAVAAYADAVDGIPVAGVEGFDSHAASLTVLDGTFHTPSVVAGRAGGEHCESRDNKAFHQSSSLSNSAAMASAM